MKRFYVILLVVLILSAGSFAADGVMCKLQAFQFDRDNQKDVLIYSDTVTFLKNVSATGFIGPFSIDVEFFEIDSIKTNFNLHLITLSPSAKTYSRNFTVEYGLPARIDKIASKNNLSYSLTLSPLEKIEVDTSICFFNHRHKDDFTFRPTAYTDLYYVPSSLGDYNWDAMKELFENNYRQFMAFCNFNLPGKILVYLYPCPSYSVIWDKRFGLASDPTRNAAYSIYNKNLNTADPFVVIHTAVLRNYGYSAPFLAEGLANYFSFAPYDMQLLIKENKILPVRSILSTYDYLTADPYIADRTAATFVKYLVDQYSIGKFIDLYKAADDIHLVEQIEKSYDKSIEDLETEWKHYLDTLRIHSQTFIIHTSFAELMLNYDAMLRYSLGYYDIAKTSFDTTEALNRIKRAYFSTGNFYKTVEFQQKIVNYDTTRAKNWMALGSYKMMVGEYDEALECFTKAKSLDSVNQMTNFNLALYYIIKKDNAAAKELLINNLSNQKEAQAQGESRLMLANILNQSDEKSNLEKAAEYYNQGLSIFAQMIQSNSSAPSLYMWCGIASLGLYDYANALNYLHTAEFIETRPFYMGMINLWLGKTYLANEEPEIAREYFTKVLSEYSADYHQKEAREYLDK